MIEFKEGRMPEQKLRTLTAYVDEAQLLMHGKTFAKEVVHRLISESVLIHRVELEGIVTEYITSSEVKEYIKNKIRETIDKYIREEVNEIFNRGKK